MDKEETTIVTDVDETESVEVEEKNISPRDAAMQAIVNDRRAEFPDSEEDEEQVAAEIDEEEDLEADEPEMVMVKVNGKELQVSQEDIDAAGGIRAYQKERAADEKLREASQKEQALRAREAELAQMEEDLLKKTKTPDIEPDELGKEFADSVFDDPDKAAQTISTLARRLKDVEEKAGSVHERTQREEAKKAQTVIEYYHGSYEDIASNQDMHSALNRRVRLLQEENPDHDHKQLIDEAAAMVYDKFGISKEPPETPQDKKRKMPKPVKKATARKAPKPEQKRKTRSEVLAEQRKGRGVHAY